MPFWRAATELATDLDAPSFSVPGLLDTLREFDVVDAVASDRQRGYFRKTPPGLRGSRITRSTTHLR